MSDFSVSASASMDLSGASAGVSLDTPVGDIGLSIDTNLKIIEMMMPINFVSFDFNPKSFSVKRKVNRNNRPAGGKSGSAPAPSPAPLNHNTYNYLGASPRVFTFTALLSEEGSGLLNALADMTAIGGGLRQRCDMLMNWTVGGPATWLSALFGAPALAQGLKIQNSNTPPLLIMQWGDPMRGFLVFGRMTDVNCDFKRFDAIGNPIRVEVKCVFEEASSDLLSLLTNPTSGGQPGRQIRTLTQGENLQNLANERYGRPGAWREVADANGIDDPMRVRPGQSISLPPPQEIGG